MERWVMEKKLERMKAEGYVHVMKKSNPVVQFEDEDAKRRYLMDKPEVKKPFNEVKVIKKPKRKKK